MLTGSVNSCRLIILLINVTNADLPTRLVALMLPRLKAGKQQ
jgi:hypothetical protein